MEYLAALGRNTDATGTIDETNMVWELDYVEQVMGSNSLTIHFEGSISAP